MSFAVRLSTDLISVEAGATMPLSIEVVNRAEEADRFELEVEGLDPEWTAVPVPTFPVGAKETATEKVFFRTPRTPESQSGNYPFVAKVRSLTSGEQRTVQGVLQVLAYHHISVEISPKRGVIASFQRKNHFTLTLMNLGNVEHALQLLGNDPDERLAFEFEQEQVTLGPGQQKEVGVTVQPTSKALLSTVKLHAFSITARSVETPSVAAVAQAQLEQRPTFTPTGLVLSLIILGLGSLWWYAQPKPPTFVMGLSKGTITKGETVNIWWQMTNADRVHISANGTDWEDIRANGQLAYTPESDKPIEIQGYAIAKDRNTPIQKILLNIVVPPPAPAPKILQFTASSTNVRVGDSVVFTYNFNPAVVKATLSPLDKDLSINDNQIQIPITDEGTKTFTLIAENKDGKADKKSVTITAKQESEVKVISFTATPTDVSDPGGLISVDWQLTNAVHVEITPNVSATNNIVDPAKGHFDYYIDKTTTFTLVAKDKNNLPVTKTVRVVVEPKPIPSPDSSGVGPESPPLEAAGGPR